MITEDDQNLGAQLEGMEKEFSKQANLLNQVMTQLHESRSEIVILKKNVELLNGENKRLSKMIMDSNNMLSGHLDYATQNIQMQKQLDYLSTQLEEERSNNAVIIGELTLDNKTMQLELEKLKNLEGDHTSHLNSLTEVTTQRYDGILAEKEQLLKELQREINFQCQQRTSMEVHFVEQLSSLNRIIVEKNVELQHIRKEYTNFSQSHEQQLQKARMKYEEQLLNIVQASNSENQFENHRRKMLVQKQEAENEITGLKKKILQLEAKQRGVGRKEMQTSVHSAVDFFS